MCGLPPKALPMTSKMLVALFGLSPAHLLSGGVPSLSRPLQPLPETPAVLAMVVHDGHPHLFGVSASARGTGSVQRGRQLVSRQHGT